MRSKETPRIEKHALELVDGNAGDEKDGQSREDSRSEGEEKEREEMPKLGRRCRLPCDSVHQ